MTDTREVRTCRLTSGAVELPGIRPRPHPPVDPGAHLINVERPDAVTTLILEHLEA